MKVTLTIDELKMPVGIEMLESIASSLKDDEVNQKFFHALAQSTSASVRNEIAYKDKISEETALLLLNDKDCKVVERMVRNDVGKMVMNQSIFEHIVSIASEEILKEIANNMENYENLSAETIAASLLSIGNPSIDIAIAGNYSAPKKVLKNLLKHEDSDVVAAAKNSLS